MPMSFLLYQAQKYQAQGFYEYSNLAKITWKIRDNRKSAQEKQYIM